MKSPFILAFAILCCAPAAHAFTSIGNPDRGRMIFAQQCTICHGEDGRGREGMAPDLVAEWHRLTKSDQELARNIRTGLQTSGKIYSGGPKPPQIMSDRDMDDVIAYMRNTFGMQQFGAPQFGTPQPRFGR